MIKALMRGDDDKPMLIFGLSHGNVEQLKKDRPILIDFAEFELKGKLVITASSEDGKAAVPEVEGDVMVFSLSHEQLDIMKGGKFVVIKVSGDFDGEIMIFSGQNEFVMKEMLAEAFPQDPMEVTQGSVCEKCGSGRRDDGTCDCNESLH